ncbi:hypothetical protein [Halocola ammonii]
MAYFISDAKEFDLSHKRRWLKSGLLLFLLASLLGTGMRYFFVREIPLVEYKHLLHAHSHVAMLGWLFTAVSGALIFLVIQKTRYLKAYWWVWILNIIASVGMAVFFTYEGYGPFSIAFSTLHLAAAYLFAVVFLKDLKRRSNNSVHRFSRWAVIWMLLSTLGLWAIAPVASFLGSHHPAYYASVQFFLHFQFNGWFTFAILALLFNHFEKTGERIEVGNGLFWILQLSLLLTYALSITWSTPETFLFYLNSAGVILQLAVFIPIIQKLVRAFRKSTDKIGLTGWLLLVGLISLFLKVLAQTAVAVPAVAEISYTIRNFVIGFIHLTLLGSITMSLMALLQDRGLIPVRRSAFIGSILLMLAFVSTEIILFGQGLLLWMRYGFVRFYYEIILGATIIFPISIGLIAIGKNKSPVHSISNTNR